MKKVTFFLLLLIVTVSCLFSWQETYSEESIQFQQMKAFSRILGTSIPTSTAPITGSQMLLFLQRLPFEKLDEDARQQFNALVDSLTEPQAILSWEPDVLMNLFISVNPQVFAHANNETPIDDWVYQYKDWYPIINSGAEFWFGKNVFAMADFNFTLRKFNYKYDSFFWNRLSSVAEFEISFPSKAYISIGTDSLNLIVGRDKLSAGNGVTGNLILGNNHWWKDFVKLSIAKLPFTYDFSIIAFDKNSNYDKNPLDLETFDLNSEHRIVVIHRFSMATWKWFNFSVSEGSLQYGTDVLSDLRLLNPMLMIHGTNGYTVGNQNNFFGFELQFLPIDGLELNFGVIFDQIQIRAELDSGKPKDDMPPNANGFMVNALYSFALDKGITTVYAEAVYTSPCLYLKNKVGSYDYWNTNLIVGNNLWDYGNSDLSYLGYKYGPDTIAVALGGNYSRLDGFKFGFDLLFKAHGEHGIRNRENQHDSVELGPEHFYDVSPTYTEGVTLPEYRLVVSGYIEMNILSWMDFSCNVAFVRDWNHNNVIGSDYYDVQMAVGFELHTPQ